MAETSLILEKLPPPLILKCAELVDPISFLRFARACRPLWNMLRHNLNAQVKKHALPLQGYYDRFVIEEPDGTLRQRDPYDDGCSGPWELFDYDDNGDLVTKPDAMHNVFDDVMYSRFRIVRQYLRAGLDPNCYDIFGQRLLLFAGKTRQTRIMQLLLNYGANPNLPSCGFEGGVMDGLCKYYCFDVPKSVIRVLAPARAKCTETTFSHLCHHRNGAAIIKTAAEYGMNLRAAPYLCILAGKETPALLRVLLNRAPEILNVRNGQNKTALDCALDMCKSRNAVYLLKNGIELHPPTEKAESALTTAIEHDFTFVIEEILRRPELDDPDWKYEFARCLQLSYRKYKFYILKLLVQKVKSCNNLPAIQDFHLYESAVNPTI
ncbi:hypothetical protein BO70DRAFT_399050 [Aspergillus heteromorphus CBS 117.55]|uniref:Uncharacterized protein n=1 Tax=Aspergillus heteromorphus CBS 117.55 TaxID=1448321 RepID=A0A317VIG0_9EURO|nr:uncharacterized protein BO70DRAFT_399050 [Aspergillus heteromorphus CBS 117.55]PWY72977.1 hypothetical protein BO70DRAFT_399050 [Aspergillus heteromorphus CBS 117.55]